MRTTLEYADDNVRARWRYDTAVAHEAVEEWCRHLESGRLMAKQLVVSFDVREGAGGRLVASPYATPAKSPDWKLRLSQVAFGRIRKWTGLDWPFVVNLLGGGRVGLEMLAATTSGRLRVVGERTALLYRPDPAGQLYVVRDFRRRKDRHEDVATFAATLESATVPADWSLIAYRISDYAHQFRYRTGPHTAVDLCFSVVRQVAYAQASYLFSDTLPWAARVDFRDVQCKLVVPVEQVQAAGERVEVDFRVPAEQIHQAAVAALARTWDPVALAARTRRVMTLRRLQSQIRDAILRDIAYLAHREDKPTVHPVLQTIASYVDLLDDPRATNRLERCAYDLLTTEWEGLAADRKAVERAWKVGDAAPTRVRQVSFRPLAPG